MPQGTIIDCDGFDANQDSEILRAAMKGLGTDEDKVIGVVCHRSNKQRQELRAQYQQMWGRNLIEDLESEFSKSIEKVLVGLFRKPIEFDAWSLHKAMAGLGTKESTLIEILCSRSNEEIKAISAEYKKLYKKELVKDLESETSGNFKKLLYSLAQGARDESEDVDSCKVEEDAKALYEAGEKSWGTEESRFNVVLASRSFAHLNHVCIAYDKLSKKNLEDAIKSEFSGDIEDGLLTIVKCARDLPTYFAERLYKSMKGAGTDDQALIRIMISRSEKDLVQIKQVFQDKYGQTLEQFIKDDTSGDYRNALIQICRGNH